MDPILHELPLEAAVDREVRLLLLGVGGAGTNAVDRLKLENLEHLRLAVINTDLRALGMSPVRDKVLIGTAITRGLSAGGDPDLGRQAAEADRDKVALLMAETDLVFLVAGLGGGTGSGAAPVVAKIAAAAGAMVIAFVMLPFSSEGGARRKKAEEALAELRQSCDAVIPLANDLLLQEEQENASVFDSFARADAWIGQGVKSIRGLLARTGLINVDFAALRQVLQPRGGKTLYGLGAGGGAQPAAAALEDLKQCPLFQTPDYARKADRLLVSIAGGPDLSLSLVNELMAAITAEFGTEAQVVMGAAIDESLAGRVEVCVLGTTNLGGRNYVHRPVRPAPRAGAGKSGRAAETAPTAASATAVTGRTAPVGAAVETPAEKAKQEEFGFQGSPVENRGSFDKSDRNLFEGQDLDVPTYLRKGIKVTV